MIITLKGADFSASNIGTLSSWRISRSLGSGTTYAGVTSVDKGAAFSATVTLAEGYEIGTAGVTITMGGTVLSGAHSISGNVITITIAEVTGNVLIKVPTVNTATGEEEEPEEPDTPVVPDTPSGTFPSYKASDLTWESGYIDASGNISQAGANDNVSTASTITIPELATKVLGSAKETISAMRTAYFDNNGVFISRTTGSSFKDGVLSDTIPSNAKLVKITVTNNETGAPTDDTVIITFS